MTTHTSTPNTLALTPQDEYLYDLYVQATQDNEARVGFSEALASQPTPHLDTIYGAVAAEADAETAFVTECRTAFREQAAHMPLVSIAGKAAVMSALIREGYPSSMQHFADEQVIAGNLQNPTADDFSFVILGADREGLPGYQAGCTAYVTASKVDPNRESVLYIDDLAVRRDGKNKLLGIYAFREVLARAAAAGQDTLEFRARRNTSYKGFRGPIMARLLGNLGYVSTDHGVVASYGKGDQIEHSHLIEVSKIR